MLAPEAAAALVAAKDESSIQGRASRLADALVEPMQEWVGQALIITLGSQGAIAMTPDGRWYVPALSVPYVSPAGAGDGMTSGIMLALYGDGSWKDAVALGTALRRQW